MRRSDRRLLAESVSNDFLAGIFFHADGIFIVASQYHRPAILHGLDQITFFLDQVGNGREKLHVNRYFAKAGNHNDIRTEPFGYFFDVAGLIGADFKHQPFRVVVFEKNELKSV